MKFITGKKLVIDRHMTYELKTYLNDILEKYGFRKIRMKEYDQQIEYERRMTRRRYV